MNKNLILGLIGVMILVGLVYFLFLNKPAQAPTTTAPQEQVIASATPSAVSEITVNLAEQNESSESGTVKLVEENGKVKVVLKMTGAPAGVTQPAHIHVGSCPDVGAVKYPLTSPVNGISETTVDVTLDQLKAQMPLAINVHKSAAEVKAYVSCGDLKL